MAHGKTNAIIGETTMRDILSIKKTTFLILLPALILVIFACRIPDASQMLIEAATERCRTVSRAGYEAASEELGQVPETPEDPENVVYQVCYVDGLPVSATMVSENKTQDDEVELDQSEENTPDADESEGAGSFSGVYVGISNYPEVLHNMGWFEPDEGEYTFHEVTIDVAEDGTVSGSYILEFMGYEDPDYVYFGTPCPGHAEATITGVFHGQLTDNNRIISSTESWRCDLLFACDPIDVCTNDFLREFKVEVYGDSMTGTTLPLSGDEPFIWSFSAEKR
jgi:hypothetical protein